MRLFLMIFNYQVSVGVDMERQMRWEDNHEWQVDTNFKTDCSISALVSDDHGACHTVTVFWSRR
jgi:phosphopantetheinyl transferase